MGIRNKLFIWISITFLLAISMLCYFSLPQIERIVFDHTMTGMSAQTDQMADNIDNWLLERSAILKSIAIQMESSSKLDAENPELPTFINLMAERFSDEFSGLYIGFANKYEISTQHNALPADFDPTKRKWYVEAMHKNGLVVTEPYKDVRTGRLVSSIAYPVQASIPGVIGTDIYLGEIYSFVNENVYNPHFKIFLISKAGTLLYANDDTLGTIGENFAAINTKNRTFYSLIQRMIAGEKDVFQIAWHGTDYYGAFVPIPTSGWSLIIFLPMSILFEESKTFIIHTVVVALIGIFMLFVSIYIIIRRITKPLEAISLTAQKVSNGDFTAKFQHSETAEIEYLVHSLELMRTNIVAL